MSQPPESPSSASEAPAKENLPPVDRPPPQSEPASEQGDYRAGYRDGFADAAKAKAGGDEKKPDDKKPDEKKTEPKKKFRPSPLALLIGLIVLAVLVVAVIYWWHNLSTHESTDDAYTAADVHQISPRVAGEVIEVAVVDNQEVREGDLLLKLDPRDFEVALQRAQANLEQAHAQVTQAGAASVQAQAGQAQAEAGVSQARAEGDQAGARYEVAGIDYGRASSLYGKDVRAVSKADVDTNKSNLDAQKAAFEAAKASIESAEANARAAVAVVSSRAAELTVSQAMVDVAAANVEDAKLQLSYCSIFSPCHGRISRKTVETGQRLSAGQAVVAVTEDDVWVLANLKETQLAHVRVGQRVHIPVDAFANHPFVGRVDSIQAGSGATYSLLPPDNATGNFTKIVQRVPVKITFDKESIKGFADLLVPGLSAEPVIDLESASDRGDHVSAGNAAPPKGPHQQ